MYVLHFTPDTAAFAVRVLLTELQLPHEARLIDRAGGALDSPAYRALHPLGKIPALETPDGPMFETAAILLWLADRHSDAAFAPAPASPRRGRFLTWYFFAVFNLHPAVLDLHYPDRVAGTGAVPGVLAGARQRVLQALAALNDAAGRDGFGDPSAPDILSLYVAMLVRWLGWFEADHPGYVALSDYPALAAAARAWESRASVRAVAEAEALGDTPLTRPRG